MVVIGDQEGRGAMILAMVVEATMIGIREAVGIMTAVVMIGATTREVITIEVMEVSNFRYHSSPLIFPFLRSPKGR